MSPRSLRLLSLVAVLAVGCAADRAAPPAPGDDDSIGRANGRKDAGLLDADAGRAEGDAETGARCVEDVARFSTLFAPIGRGFALAVDGLTVHLAYTTASCSGAGNEPLGHAVAYARFQTSEAVGERTPLAITEDGACAEARDLSLSLHEVDGVAMPTLSFLSTRDGPWDAYELEPALAAPRPRRLSEDAGDREARELRTLGRDDHVLQAWVRDASPGQSEVLGRLEGAPFLLVDAASGFDVAALALGELGDGRGGTHTVLALASRSDEQHGVYLLRLDDAAMLTDDGEARPITTALPPSPALQVAMAETGGALVYTDASGEELRFRRLDSEARPVGAEVKLTSGNERALSPSVASFLGGYVVAYRSVLRERESRAMLRLSFVDSQGNRAGVRDALETSSGGGPSDLLATVDGRLILAYREVDDGGQSQLHVARISCGR